MFSPQLYEACKIEDLPSSVNTTSDYISDVKLYINRIDLNSMMTKNELIINGRNNKRFPRTTINIIGDDIINIAGRKKVKKNWSSLKTICSCY